MALGEVELRGFAILTSIFLIDPFRPQQVLSVITYNRPGAIRVLERYEAVSVVGPELLGLERQQDVIDVAELLEVGPELLCLADRGSPGWECRR